MSSTNDFETSSFSSSDDDNGVELIYRGASIAANIYELQQRKIAVAFCWGVPLLVEYTSIDRVSANETLMRDYFDENCTYPNEIFRRRFRMNRCVFLRIHDAILKHEPTNFLQRRDAAQKLGLSSLQKMTTAIRILAYGTAGDSVDDYLKVPESTTLNSLKAFCTAVIEIFSDEYLRNPTKEDMECILAENARRGFPGMLGSLDCMH